MRETIYINIILISIYKKNSFWGEDFCAAAAAGLSQLEAEVLSGKSLA